MKKKENKSQEDIKVVDKNNDLNDNSEETIDNDRGKQHILSKIFKRRKQGYSRRKTNEDLEKEVKKTKDKMLRVLAESENAKQIGKTK